MGRVVGLSPLLPRTEPVRLRRTRVPEHAMSDHDRDDGAPRPIPREIHTVTPSPGAAVAAAGAGETMPEFVKHWRCSPESRIVGANVVTCLD